MNHKHTLTSEGVSSLKDELRKLKIQREENIVALKEARAQGDLSENADYDNARNQQAEIAGRINEIEKILKNYILIQEDGTNNLGKSLTIQFLDDNSLETYKIVGSLEADPLNRLISYESPLGNAVLNHQVGDKITVKPADGEPYEIQIIAIK